MEIDTNLIYITKEKQTSMVNYAMPVWKGKISSNGNGTLAQVNVIPANTLIKIIPNSQNPHHPTIYQAIAYRWGETDTDGIFARAIFFVDTDKIEIYKSSDE